MNKYNVYIICKNEEIFNERVKMLEKYKKKICKIQLIPAEFLKVTSCNKKKLLCKLNTRYNTGEKNKISKLGCISAHRKALLAIINNQTSNNIILEEDSIVSNNLPSPPKISCYLGGWIIPPQITKAGKEKIKINNLKYNQLNTIDYNKFKVLMAHSYFIKTIKEAETILLSTININKIKNYDVHLIDNKFFNHFYYPPIFVQGKHVSDIDNKINKNHIYTTNYGLNYNLKSRKSKKSKKSKKAKI